MPTASPSAGHPRFARTYAGAVGQMDSRGAAEHRRELLARARGVVVEVGAGAGSNFAHYPGTVERVLAVEPDPYLRAVSAEAARRVRLPIEVRDSVAEALPVGDGGVDT